MASDLRAFSSSSCSPPLSIRPWNHDVFLNFRGEDVRQNFISHLYQALDGNGINTYIDVELVRGEAISQALVKAIEGSNIAIILFSKNYARSRWCLDELLKILDCKETMNQIVLPIFLDVNLLDVRYQKGSFGKSFNELEDRLKDNAKMLKWKEALKRVTYLPGFSSENFRDEAMLIKSVVEYISRKLIDRVGDDGKLLSYMASTINIETTPSSPSSPSIHPSNYDVFISFSHADIRRNFISHLYQALDQKGINTYKDDNFISHLYQALDQKRIDTYDVNLEIWEDISAEIFKTIEESKILIIVFSKNYARSRRCLEELLKILDCKETMNQIVLPIFYDVNPSEVRHQKGSFGESFDKLGDRVKNNAKMLKWREALKSVANLSGFMNFWDEAKLIKEIVNFISRKLIDCVTYQKKLINCVDDDEDKLMSDMASNISIETTPSPAPSSSSEHRWKYEVFLSFRGETHDIFTSHLCNELCEKFISTFKDDDKLVIGRPIKKEVLLDAIDKSIMAVIIISKEYASSIWCLEELAKIVECMKDREMKVLPIFYHVDPSDVGKPDDTFRDAFAEHEKNIENKDKVQTWRNALKKVANLSGCHLKSGDELTFIKEIVKMISRELIDLIDDHEDNLVGIDSRVNEMHLQLGIEFNDVRIIGICGMSGMGKTTLARRIFQKFNYLFQAKSFLENVSLVSKRNGLVALQEKILTDMKLKFDQEKWDVLKGIDVIRNRLLDTKVLIVLDDVDEKEQLETLAGNCNWFGPGSRIIVTTGDECLLTAHGVIYIYPIKGLHKNEALQLFSQEAFRNPNQCEDQDFWDLCNDYVSCADGHPLALKVLGSSLLGKGREVWKRSLNKIQGLPNRDIQQQLQIGFDALGETEKKMFLDIACFFNGEDKDRVVDLLEDSDCFPKIDIETLVDKSLVTILGRKLWMHSLLQRMGWEIEHHDKLGKRSRLWRRDDIFEVLRENSGTYKVQGIMLSTSSTLQEEDLNPEAFSKMDKLRLIKICDVNLPWGLNSLSNWLRLMEWHEYPLGSIPESFQPSNLVELIMHRSNFRQLPMAFLKLKKLKVMDFSGSEYLRMTPDFSGCPSLQRLIFDGCTRLYEVHPSIGALKHLILLNLKDCKCLSSLLHEINLESLNLLILSGCSRFNKFPEIGQNMKLLSELYLDGTAIEELPLSIQHLTCLTLLNLGECKKLLVFPSDIYCLPALKTLILSGSTLTTLWLLNSFSGLKSLVSLDLSDCNLLDGALDNLSSLSSLESLNLSRNNFTHLPQSISQLPNLKFLCLDNCSRLQVEMAREYTSLQNYNQVVLSTLSRWSITDDIKLSEASEVGSAHKRKMEDAFGQKEW